VIRSQVIRLDPTHKQVEFFRQCVGTARFAYNWALNEWQERHSKGLTTNEAELSRQINAIKRTKFPWMLALPKRVVQQAITNLNAGYQNFFNSVNGKRKGPKVSAPTFKSKHTSKSSARLDNGQGTFIFRRGAVRLPKVGWVKTFEELRFEGKPLSATISFVGQRWWVSVQVELPDVELDTSKPSVGIDLGIKTALVLSDGTTFDAPKPLKYNLEKLRRLNRSVSRKVKGSNNRKKAAVKLSRLHWRIAQIRKDWQHKTTTAIAKRFSHVGLEDLNVKGMMENHCLSRAISDIGFGEIRRQLSYKVAKVVVISRWLPSTKTCSNCGCMKDTISLSERVYHCDHCGFEIDRDLNAAINIHTASCAGINACGDGSAGTDRKASTKLPSSKQELGRTLTSTN